MIDDILRSTLKNGKNAVKNGVRNGVRNGAKNGVRNGITNGLSGGDLAKQALNHEMIHATAMKISKNKLAYTDDTVTYEGNIYPRKDIDGKDMIQDIETGQWKEAGDHTWPWEEDANILTSDPEIKQ